MGRIHKHRRHAIPLLGVGIMTCACGPLLYAFKDSQTSLESHSNESALSDIQAQTDDAIRLSSDQWPEMSLEKREQTREALIEEGLSPMQADAILPYAQSP